MKHTSSTCLTAGRLDLASHSPLLSNVQRKQIAHASCAACFNIHQQTDVAPRFNNVKTYAANPSKYHVR